MSIGAAIRTHEERRMHAQLLEFWESIKQGSTTLPREQDVDLSRLQEWWPQMFLLDIQRKDFPMRLHYSYMGEELVSAVGGDLSGQCIGSLTSVAALAQEGLQEAAERVVTTCEPLMQEGDCLDRHGVWVHYRRVLLPLTRDGHQVDYILGGVAWRLA